MNVVGLSIGSTCALLGLVGGGYAWDYNLREQVYQEIRLEMLAGNIELDLQRVELELKLLRTIRERRPLTEDEIDRKEYLQKLREVLLTNQRQRS